MKKVYSVILLLTFLLGTLQPIMPMVEYQLFEGSLIELLTNDACPSEEPCDMFQCFPDVDCPACDDTQKLLDANYYPLALKMSAPLIPCVFRPTLNISPVSAENNPNPTYAPNPPPPKGLKQT